MLKGFRNFILRGNVVELSTAVVIGSAFTALVGSVTDNVLRPLVAAAGGVSAEGVGFRIWPGNPETFVDIGAVFTAAVTFLITAAVVYFGVVLPMNRINAHTRARAGAAASEEQPVPVDTALLTEMRDLLRQLTESSGRH
ncbi:large conductance mechanosensitive channel protein MscL [Arthrobacter sp. TMN-37]